MRKKPEVLPPDEMLTTLTAAVNAQLPQGAYISFHYLEHPGGRLQVGITFAFHGHRSVKLVDEIPKLDDAAKLIKKLNTWIDGVPPPVRWTTDLADAERIPR